MPPPVFRFAPSPNGYLHLGHAYSALLNFDLARRSGGRLLLRIEDIDPARCRPEFEAAIYEDLAWLGISWETPVRRQSEHLADYRAAIGKTDGHGADLSGFRKPRRDCTAGGAARGACALAARSRWRAALSGRGEIAVAGRARTAARIRRALCAAARHGGGGAQAADLRWAEHGEGPDGETGVVAARPEAWGDVILARKETPTSYHLSVVIDDALQGVTDVVRGADLFWSTSVHRLLQPLLGLPQPAYRHHRLVLDGEGRKLAKSIRGDRLARTAGAGRDPRRHPPPGRPALVVVDQVPARKRPP